MALTLAQHQIEIDALKKKIVALEFSMQVEFKRADSTITKNSSSISIVQKALPDKTDFEMTLAMISLGI